MCSEILWCSLTFSAYFCAVSLNWLVCLPCVPATALGSGGQLSPPYFSASPLIAKNSYILLTIGHTFLGHFVLALRSAASWMLSAGPSLAREAIIALRSTHMGPHPKYCVWFWDPQFKEGMGILVQLPWRATKMHSKLEQRMYRKKWRDLGLFRWKEGHWGILLLSMTT